MKLANALSQRSELQERIRQLEGRLLNNAKVQEGEVPAEDPQELLKELEEHYAQLERYIAAINRTNSRTLVEFPCPTCWPGGTAGRKSSTACGTFWTAPASWPPGAPWGRSRFAAPSTCGLCRRRLTGRQKNCGSWTRRSRRPTGRRN